MFWVFCLCFLGQCYSVCDRWPQRSASDSQLPGFALSHVFLQGQEGGTPRILSQKTAWPQGPPSGPERVWPINFQLLPRTKSFLRVHKSKRRLQGTVKKKKERRRRSLYFWDNLRCHQTCFQESLTVFGNIRPACTLEHVWKAWHDSSVEVKAFQHFEECLELSLLIFQASLYLRLKDAFHRKIFFFFKKNTQKNNTFLLCSSIQKCTYVMLLSGVQTVGRHGLVCCFFC